MRFLIVGAGAVGALVGAQLARAGHDVRFWARPRERSTSRRLKIESVASGDSFEVSVPFLAEGDAFPHCDWVFVCVRGEQLDEALQLIATHSPAQDLVVATISVESVVARARRHGLQGKVLAQQLSLGVFRAPEDRDQFRWLPFGPPGLISAEGERSNRPEARKLAAALSKAGLRTIALPSARNMMTLMARLSGPFLAAWDLCDFQLEQLSRDRALRQLAASALVETQRSTPLTGPSKLLRLLPRWFWSAILRLLPLIIGKHGRQLWLHHGPKVRAQTRDCLGQVQQTPAVSELRTRFRQRFPPEQPLLS